MKPLFVLHLAVFLLLQACQPPKGDVLPGGGRKPDTESIAPGFGQSDARPTGEPLKLPPGLALRNLYGSYGDDRKEAGKAGKLRGSGYGAQLLAVFQNTTSRSITLTLPAGLTFIPIDNTFKNVMLVKQVTLHIAPNAEERYVLMAYEINVREIYDVPGADYQLGPVAHHPILGELFQRIAGKKINFEEWRGTEPDKDFYLENKKYDGFRDNAHILIMALLYATQDGKFDGYVLNELNKLK